MLTFTLGGGVPPKHSNPDPISNPKRHFLHSIVSQGEEYLPTLWVAVCCPSLQILNMGLINKVDIVCLSPVGYGV